MHHLVNLVGGLHLNDYKYFVFAGNLPGVLDDACLFCLQNRISFLFSDAEELIIRHALRFVQRSVNQYIHSLTLS